jgi:hypothetical protein
MYCEYKLVIHLLLGGTETEQYLRVGGNVVKKKEELHCETEL